MVKLYRLSNLAVFDVLDFLSSMRKVRLTELLILDRNREHRRSATRLMVLAKGVTKSKEVMRIHKVYLKVGRVGGYLTAMLLGYFLGHLHFHVLNLVELDDIFIFVVVFVVGLVYPQSLER